MNYFFKLENGPPVNPRFVEICDDTGAVPDPSHDGAWRLDSVFKAASFAFALVGLGVTFNYWREPAS